MSGSVGARRNFRPRRSERGAALLVAILLLTLVATVAAHMVWQQWRATEIEAAERARSQGAWILQGAQDWARLILREDARSGKPTSLNEPWATPLAEARLSSFLATDREHTDESTIDAFISGEITDAQSRYNLRNLVFDGKLVPEQVEILTRLCQIAGIGPGTARTIADQWLAAATGAGGAPLSPALFDDLAWFGLPTPVLEALRPFIVVLPNVTGVNLNTASREVLGAVIAGIDLGAADRLVQQRKRAPFASVEDARKALGLAAPLPPRDLAVQSAFFEVRGRMRLDDRVLESTALVERRGGLDVVTIARSMRPVLATSR